MPRAYFVLLKIVTIQKDVRFRIVSGKMGYQFESDDPSFAEHRGKYVEEISDDTGKYVEEISDGTKDISLAKWSWEAGKTYSVRLTKNIILRSRISCEFLVWF